MFSIGEGLEGDLKAGLQTSLSLCFSSAYIVDDYNC